MSKKAIIVGATGLIGKNLVNILLNHPEYKEVLILVRKKLALSHPKLTQLLVDFDQIQNYEVDIKGDVLFSCLGTTKKQTPDELQYRKIDHDYPIAISMIALKNGAQQMHVVSAPGANASSSIFYLKLKGETEDDLKKIGIPSLNFYQPSLLTGRTESRPMETVFATIFKFINPLLIGSAKKYRSISGHTVASAMINQSLKTQQGVFVYNSAEIENLGGTD